MKRLITYGSICLVVAVIELFVFSVLTNRDTLTVKPVTITTIKEGELFVAKGSFEDFIADDDWQVNIDYGDGSDSQILLLEKNWFTLNHTYRDDGRYTITARATGNEGNVKSGTLTVKVKNLPPAVDVGTDTTLEEGGLFSHVGVFSDPGPDEWTAEVDYGDGSGSHALSLGGNRFTLNHTYLDDGRCKVTVRVTDDDGAGVVIP